MWESGKQRVVRNISDFCYGTDQLKGTSVGKGLLTTWESIGQFVSSETYTVKNLLEIQGDAGGNGTRQKTEGHCSKTMCREEEIQN